MDDIDTNQNKLKLPVQKLSPESITPKKAHKKDAGFDLFSRTHITLNPGERYKFSTGIAMKIPDNYMGMICDRSGNANQKGLHVIGQVVDSTYIGEIGVCLVNLGSLKQVINLGDKIAQIVIFPIAKIDETIEVTELENTERGTAGFGSTG